MLCRILQLLFFVFAQSTVYSSGHNTNMLDFPKMWGISPPKLLPKIVWHVSFHKGV